MYYDDDMPDIYANITVGEETFIIERNNIDEITEEVVEFLESVPFDELIIIDINDSQST